jgi:hypothetical protein
MANQVNVPIPQNKIEESFAWRDWLQNLSNTVYGPQQYTVVTLPSYKVTMGRRAYVTDATAPTFLGTLTGGGTVVCPVFYNGTAWVAG